MKANMKRIVTALLSLLFCVAVSARDKVVDPDKLVGDWSFSAPEAPYGYQDGHVRIKKADGKLAARVDIQGGVVEVKEIRAKGDAFFASFYVDGTPVDLTLTPKGDKLEGTADAMGMRIPVKFKKTGK